MKSASSARVVIDRIEGDLAVLVLYEDDGVKFNMPLRLLPEGAREGDHLLMTFAEDKEGREAETKRIGNLLDELKGK
ncbi:MAG TPA: DUF3006 domain-containing protein [Blastocatellia bacterium]|nr:DUF3006 domain-containing protein [Blastocatellia bacterium]